MVPLKSAIRVEIPPARSIYRRPGCVEVFDVMIRHASTMRVACRGTRKHEGQGFSPDALDILFGRNASALRLLLNAANLMKREIYFWAGYIRAYLLTYRQGVGECGS